MSDQLNIFHFSKLNLFNQITPLNLLEEKSQSELIILDAQTLIQELSWMFLVLFFYPICLAEKLMKA